MPYLRDTVIILKKEPTREHDRRYTMYGREHGLVMAVARGASSPRSKQAGHLEPFSESEVMIAKGVAFDKLAVAKLVHCPWQASHDEQLAAYAVCGAVADLVMRLIRPGVADERIFFLLQETIQTLFALPHAPTPLRARLVLSAATLHLLDCLGFAPQIEKPADGTTAVPSLTLVAFMRRASLIDVLRITAPAEALHAAADFVEKALQETHLEREPHGPATILTILG